LALLSLFIKNNKVEHKSLVESIVDPNIKDFDLDEVNELTTPALSIVSQLVKLMQEKLPAGTLFKLSLSSPEEREE